MDDKSNVENDIKNSKERVEEDIRYGKEKVGKGMDKSRNVAEKVSNDFGKTMDDVIIGMKAFQKNLDDKFQEYKESAPLRIEIDLVEVNDYYFLKADMPGVAKDNIEIEATENSVLIKGTFETIFEDIERPCEVEPTLLIAGRKVGDAQRSIKLPENINPEGISAKYHDGTLFLEIPKVSISKTKVNIN